ncbi:hypothetical protein KC866_00420 [Patescibacteria group bacterium]|nr:hypothetical protein [Patescibacteria group bacterium]
MSIFIPALAKKGWLPAVNFWFDNQIVIGVPGKGCYIFYDKNQLTSKNKYKDVQDSIDTNENFVVDFKRRTDELFGAIFFKCLNINLENLSLMRHEDLLAMYQDFIRTMMVGPIITVQLWGIEACFDENYKIISFLRKRLKELGKEDQFDEYKNILATNIGETVAFTEQKNFYQVALKMSENQKVQALFDTKDIEKISNELHSFEEENTIFEQHTEKYEWVNTEYVSGAWSREQWIELFMKSIVEEDMSAKARQLQKNFDELNQHRQEIIEELDPPKNVLHALDALSEFIAQRDWTKGYFTRILLMYNKLLKEIARRLNVESTELFEYSQLELEQALKTKIPLSPEEIINRKQNGFALIVKGGNMQVTTNKDEIASVIEQEGISSPFDNTGEVDEFKGLSASLGKITAKARVLEDATRINELEEGEVLVTYMTTIEFIPGFRKASAVITDEGGMSCHAAIVSREFKLPCIVGTKVATRALKTGDLIEVDADNGVVRVLEKTE